MTVTVNQIIAGVVPCVLALAWLFRLQGRLDVTDARYMEIIGRLERIEENQDRRVRHHATQA
jgi:Na+/melibiose symporter-like transporter